MTMLSQHGDVLVGPQVDASATQLTGVGAPSVVPVASSPPPPSGSKLMRPHAARHTSHERPIPPSYLRLSITAADSDCACSRARWRDAASGPAPTPPAARSGATLVACTTA